MEDSSPVSRIRQLSSDQRAELLRKLQKDRKTGAELTAMGLKKAGIIRMSGISGIPLYEMLGHASRKGIRILGMRRQLTATVAAATDNFISGKLVHANYLSPGPGSLEAVTGIHVARDNNLPLLVIGASRSLATRSTGDFQDLDVVPIVESITKAVISVNKAANIVPSIREAASLAMDGLPGPVFVDIPEDILSQSAMPENKEEAESPDGSIALAIDRIASVSDLLLESERPLLCLGEELRWGYSASVLEDFVSRFQIPFITTPQGRGFLPDDHPMCMNSVRRKAMHLADSFILAGGWFDWRLRKGAELAEGCRIVHAFPEEQFLGKNVDAYVTCLCQPMELIRQLVSVDLPEPVARTDWMHQLTQLSSVSPLPSNWKARRGFVGPEHLYRQIAMRIPRECVIAVEGSVHLSLASHFLDSFASYSRFDPGRSGCIGIGIPQAIGACLADPQRAVLAIVGDTGFGMTGMDLETVVRHGLNLKVIITNNSGITGALRQREAFGDSDSERAFMFQDRLPYDDVARALGMTAWSVDAEEELSDVLDAFFSTEGPACLNVHLDPDTPVPAIW